MRLIKIRNRILVVFILILSSISCRSTRDCDCPSFKNYSDNIKLTGQLIHG